MKRIISIVICAILLLSAGAYAFFAPSSAGGTAETGENDTRILRLWHIDSFEGGKGSRAAFLSRVASEFEKREENVYVMVRTLTLQGAAEALQAGDVPDLLSFSCGLDGVAENCHRLQYSFGGGEVDGGTYAYPWCAGKYYFFCLEDDFTALSAETLVLSEGGNNLPAAAAALSGIVGGVRSEDSTSAYVHFLNGKYRYMLGTQRDVCRFQTRGVNVFSKALTAYSDLYQYIAVTTSDENKESLCGAFIDLLLSDEIQEGLSDIGMYSLKDSVADNTLSAFVSKEGLSSAREAAAEALQSGEIKILKSYLKTLN